MTIIEPRIRARSGDNAGLTGLRRSLPERRSLPDRRTGTSERPHAPALPGSLFPQQRDSDWVRHQEPCAPPEPYNHDTDLGGRARDRVTLGILLLADAIAVLVAVLTASPVHALLIFVVAALVWKMTGLYSRRFTMSLLDDVPAVALGVLCGTALSALMLSGGAASPVVAAAVLVTATLGTRGASYAVIRRMRRKSEAGFCTAVLGRGPMALTLVERILAHPETGLRLVGMLDESPPEQPSLLGVPYLGTAADLDRVVAHHKVRDLLVCDGELSSTELVEVVRTCSRLDISIHVVPTLLQMHRLASTTDQVWGIPLERVRRNTVSGPSWRFKRVMDVVLSGAALVVLSPVLVLTALAVRRELGPGLIFRQERVGLDGRIFSLLKLRSMPHPGANQEHAWSVRGENLVGPVGRFIRKYSLDEIPQLFNVLVGDMSLVGPRPERPRFVELFSNEVTGYGHRHRVPVGVTGLAAVEGLRGDTSMHDRAFFDNSYIENWSLWLDLKILMRTVFAVLRGTGG